MSNIIFMLPDEASREPVELELPQIKPGSTWSWTFYVQSKNGQSQNTAGYTFQMIGKKRINGTTVFEISTSNGKCVMTADSGKFVQTLSASETALINCKSIVWDCVLTASGGSPKMAPFQGIDIPIKVLDRVTI